MKTFNTNFQKKSKNRLHRQLFSSATLPRISSMSRWQSIPIVCRSSSDSVRNTTRSISSRTITSMYRARSRSRKMLATVMRCSSCRLARGVPRMMLWFRCSLAVIMPVDLQRTIEMKRIFQKELFFFLLKLTAYWCRSAPSARWAA